MCFLIRFQPSPDFKGIKTQFCGKEYGVAMFQPSPDFKGIKTLSWLPLAPFSRSNPALISKGLRRLTEQIADALHTFQPSPDFKGIKTIPLLSLGDGRLVPTQP